MSIKQLRYVILAGLFAIPFIPLVVSKSLLFPFITGKAFYFRMIVEIIFASWFILCLSEREYRPKFSWINIAVLAFLVTIGLADMFSENPFKSFWSNFERMEGFISLLHFGAFYLVLTSVFRTDKSIWNKFFSTSLAASAIMAVYSFLQIAGKITINQGGVRVDGTFGNATYLGIYMVFHLFLAGYLFLNTQKSFSKYLLGILSLANLVVLYYTATRGAILGLLGGAVIVFCMLLIKSEKGDYIRKIALISVVTIFAFVGVFLITKNSDYVKNNPVLGRFASISISELRTQGRYYVWPIAWKGFLDRPILGWGQESFNFVFNQYYNPQMYNQEAWFDRTHNIVLDWLVAGGLLGFLAYASMFLTLGIALFKRSNFSRNERAVLVGLICAYIFHNLFVFDQIGSYILFFAVLAFVDAHSSSPTPAWAEKISSNLQKFADNKTMTPIASSVLVILIASALYFGNIVPMQSNLQLMKILTANAGGQLLDIQEYQKPFVSYNMAFPESLEHISNIATNVVSNPQVSTDFKQKIFTTINAAFATQVEKIPDDARYRLFYGIFLSSFGDEENSLAQLEEARKLSPQKQAIYFQIGSGLLSTGKKVEALAAFKTAYELDQSYEEARFLYGLAALSAGNQKLSNDLFSVFSRDRLIADDRYLTVLAGLGRWGEVIAIAKERIALDPTNMQHRITLAASYLQSGQREMAVSVIQQIIDLNPSFQEKGDYYIKEIRAGRNP